MTIHNGCSTQTVSGQVYVANTQCQGGGYYGTPIIELSPNPANDYINVNLVNTPPDFFADGRDIDYYVVDQYSNIKKTVSTSNLTETIGTSDLMNGVYHIIGQYSDQMINSLQFIVQH